MISTYRSLDEARKARLPPPIKKVICTCIQNLLDAYGEEYDPEDDGYIVLYTRDTTDQDALDLFGRTWCEGLYEGVTFDEPSRCYMTCVLFNNEEGVTIVVPDEPDLDPVFREVLEANLV